VQINQINSALLNFLERLDSPKAAVGGDPYPSSSSRAETTSPAAAPKIIKTDAKLMGPRIGFQELLTLQRVQGIDQLKKLLRGVDQVQISYEGTDGVIDKNICNGFIQALNKFRVYVHNTQQASYQTTCDELQQLLRSMQQQCIYIYMSVHHATHLKQLSQGQQQRYKNIISREFELNKDDDLSGVAAIIGGALMWWFTGGLFWTLLGGLGGAALSELEEPKSVTLIKLVKYDRLPTAGADTYRLSE